MQQVNAVRKRHAKTQDLSGNDTLRIVLPRDVGVADLIDAGISRPTAYRLLKSPTRIDGKTLGLLAELLLSRGESVVLRSEKIVVQAARL